MDTEIVIVIKPVEGAAGILIYDAFINGQCVADTATTEQVRQAINEALDREGIR